MGTTIERGYLEDPLNQWPLDAAVAERVEAIQFRAVIDGASPIAGQFLSDIIDFASPIGAQTTITPSGMLAGGAQFLAGITLSSAIGSQSKGTLETATARGAQFLGQPTGIAGTGNQFEGNPEKLFPTAMQFIATVSNARWGIGTQFSSGILDRLSATGAQSEGNPIGISAAGGQFSVTATQPHPMGVQFRGALSTVHALAGELLGNPVGILGAAIQFSAGTSGKTASATQFKGYINDRLAALAASFRTNTVFHSSAGYLVEDYLVAPYLVDRIIAITSCQFEAITTHKKPTATQFLAELDRQKVGASQFLGIINTAEAIGTQFHGHILDYLKATGTQFRGTINVVDGNAVQFEGHIQDFLDAFGVQFTGVAAVALASQFRAALYNTKNLRILCDFPSRGTSGLNWYASSTASGDFSVNNLNTDIVEQVWRTADGVKTAVTLTCDTGIPQGVFTDTLAILNHNLTTSAQVEITAANLPDFSGTVKTFQLQMTSENTYWIAPELPLDGYRYWRLVINDGTNAANFLSIGTIVFGESIMLHQENFADPIRLKKTHYSDRVETEGFTAAQNDRGIKRSLSLDFKSLNAAGGNYDNLQDIFLTSRTNLKCLWIPTPEYPGRYAVFAKLTELPEETHVDHGENADYVDFSIEMDEAR